MNPLRPVILAAANSARMREFITKVPVTAAVVRRFVAGETRAELLDAVDALRRGGRMVSVDYLGENITEADQADAVVAEYVSLINELASRYSPALASTEVAPVEVSVKLSALGQALPGAGKDLATENLRIICTKAAQAGVWVTVDAEDHTTTDATLATVRELREEFPLLGVALQAQLHRTATDCHELAGPDSRIRLCKGAYHEPVDIATHRGRDVTDSYLRCLAILMCGDGYPMVASHDPVAINAAERLRLETRRETDGFEHQMLYGVRESEQARLVHAGATVRVYVPYGDAWYRYLTRRLAERPGNLRFFLRALVRDS
ncbi:proline dehydrogenase family protein [Nocardia callitridis]|uniref:proline dehydrogenase n=1 Tax=Nocardia callitridis TaxID=648753 RepID=A0ABP9JRX8_9NOCA